MARILLQIGVFGRPSAIKDTLHNGIKQSIESHKEIPQKLKTKKQAHEESQKRYLDDSFKETIRDIFND